MKYIAILRGINVGGKRRILMKNLVTLFKDSGFSNVRTYIQSGNVLFDCRGTHSLGDIEQRIEDIIYERYGFSVPVIVRTSNEWENIIRSNYFIEKGVPIEHCHLTFLKSKPSVELSNALNIAMFLPDEAVIIDNHVFVKCSAKYSDSKLTNDFFEKKLKVQATTRNWKTIEAISKML